MSIHKHILITTMILIGGCTNTTSVTKFNIGDCVTKSTNLKWENPTLYKIIDYDSGMYRVITAPGYEFLLSRSRYATWSKAYLSDMKKTPCGIEFDL